MGNALFGFDRWSIGWRRGAQMVWPLLLLQRVVSVGSLADSEGLGRYARRRGDDVKRG